jgi:hypothetical protein
MQVDRDMYRDAMQKEIGGTPGLTVHEGTVEDLVVDKTQDPVAVVGIRLADGTEVTASAVVSVQKRLPLVHGLPWIRGVGCILAAFRSLFRGLECAGLDNRDILAGRDLHRDKVVSGGEAGRRAGGGAGADTRGHWVCVGSTAHRDTPTRGKRFDQRDWAV